MRRARNVRAGERHPRLVEEWSHETEAEQGRAARLVWVGDMKHEQTRLKREECGSRVCGESVLDVQSGVGQLLVWDVLEHVPFTS